MTEASGYRPRGVRISAIAALLVLLAFPFLLLHLYIEGSLIVRDPDGAVARVWIRNSTQEADASKFFFRWWTTAKIEGEAVVLCTNGREINFGYFTSATHVWETVGAQECGA